MWSLFPCSKCELLIQFDCICHYHGHNIILNSFNNQCKQELLFLVPVGFEVAGSISGTCGMETSATTGASSNRPPELMKSSSPRQ